MSPPSIANKMSPPIYEEFSPNFAPLPESVVVPALDLDLGCEKYPLPDVNILSPVSEISDELHKETNASVAWREDLTQKEKIDRQRWLSGGRGRSGLRIVIVTENFLPKVDGVTRTLARLLEHLEKEGHKCMLLGPGSGMDSYAGHPLVGTAGVPLVLYPGLKLNFLRPKFLRAIMTFQPDIVHFVDPIWLGAQTMMAMELGWAGEEWVGKEGPAFGGGISGAVVASYHTNLATYATLFGQPRLEPVIWRFQRWLHSKTLLTLCPSQSTTDMLYEQGFGEVRQWPRGVDLSQFTPSKRSDKLRAEWGVGEAPGKRLKEVSGFNHMGRKASLPLTPPESPMVRAADTANSGLPPRVVLLFVGRVSWEKNLHLLLAAFKVLPSILPVGQMMPKLVFVGDGPAHAEIKGICEREGYDAAFMGFRYGDDLARCYASADVFTFPSFTETFGQVVLESMASGLPVLGLDAEGTRDLVSHQETGLLLPMRGTTSWPNALRSMQSETFESAAADYAGMIARVVTDHALRNKMAEQAGTAGIEGYTWWDAMEKCVDGYREALRLSLAPAEIPMPGSPRVSRVNKVVSHRLAPKMKDVAMHRTVEPWTKRGRILGFRLDITSNLIAAFQVTAVLWICWLVWRHFGCH